MLEYIENSGGEDYPFRSDGEILRVASVEDLNRWSGIQAETRELMGAVKQAIADAGLADEMHLVDIEPILSQEQLLFFYMAKDRIDFRDLVQQLARTYGCRIEMRQVGARDEARLTADYERCGQHCCCQNFLKVLKPVSMRSAKMQKATLDPLKISGRCGRLMCCLRYEDETYADLKSRLPHRKTRVGTPDGPGIVIDSKILVQLVLVKLEADDREIAVPVEELCDPDLPVEAQEPAPSDPLRGIPSEQFVGEKKRRRSRRSRKDKGDGHDQQSAYREASKAEDGSPGMAADSGALAPGKESTDLPKRKRRRRRGGKGRPEGAAPSESAKDPEKSPKKKSRRRRRKRGGGGGHDGGGASSSG
jgi:cell fate regulator YaaT (PSP1 superfamily)